MRRVFRLVFLGLSLCGVAIATLLVAMWIEHRVPVELPVPGGAFPVSRMSEVWRDDSRPDALPEAKAPRTELVAWIWYPSTGTATTRAEYFPPEWRTAIATQQGPIVRNLFMRDPLSVRAHAVVGGAVTTSESSYPVVILRGGLGALTLNYTTFAETLASHGYIVVAFDAPYRTAVVAFSDGRVARRPATLNPEFMTGNQQQEMLRRLEAAWARDIGFALDRLQGLNRSSNDFTGRLNLGAVAVVGHSLGGASAVEFCRSDLRCRVAVDMDGALYGPAIDEGIPRPVLFLLSDHGDHLNQSDQRIGAELRSAYDHSPAASRLALSIAGAGHFSFTDQPLLRSRAFRFIDATKIDASRALVIAADVVRRFLDVHLKGAPRSVLQDLKQTYPEVREGF